jgi:hypothetical protein
MFKLENYETFSHTHRSFDFDEMLSDIFIKELKEKYIQEEDQFQDFLFIQDKSIIECLYNYSSLPDTDQFKFNHYKPRKNSQLLAPLVILAIPKIYDYDTLALTGKLYSIIAHTAIKQGYQTGFCICYDNTLVETLLVERNYIKKNTYLNQIPFLTIGHQLKHLPYNFQQTDVNKLIDSYKKINKDTYITIT